MPVASTHRFKLPQLSPFLSLVTLATEETGKPRTSWAQLARTGDFYDPRYGDFTISRKDLASMAENFKTGRYPQNPTELAFDYNHGTGRPNSDEQGKASGWLKDLELRANGDELWGLVEWTDRAAALIEAKEYRFVSATLAFEYTNSNGGDDLGPTLLAAALTNRPVIHGMQPVSLSLAEVGALKLADAPADADETAEALFSFDEQRRRVQAALTATFGVPYGYAPPDYYQPYRGVYLETLFDGRAVFCNVDGDKFSVTFAIGADGAVSFTSEPVEVRVSYEPLAAALGAEEILMSTMKVKDAKGHEIELSQESIDAVVKAHAPKPTEPLELAALKQTVETQGATITSLQAEKDAAAKRVEALELSAKTQKADASVEALVRAGKLDPKDREIWHALAMQDEANFTKLSATLVPKREIGIEAGVGSDRTEGAAKQTLELAITEELKADPKLTREQAYAAALTKHPELYSDLQ